MRVTLRLKTDELLQDVVARAYDEWQTAEAGSRVADVLEDGNEAVVRREMDGAYNDVLGMVQGYLMHNSQCIIHNCGGAFLPHGDVAHQREVHDDNVLREKDEYVIGLEMPGSWPATAVSALEQNVHEYVVSKVMAAWLEQNGRMERAEVWRARCAEAGGMIRLIKDYRVGGVRRRCL